MVELQRSLQPSPAQSLRYSCPQSVMSCPSRPPQQLQVQPTPPPSEPSDRKSTSTWNGSAAIALRLAVPPSETETLPSPLTFRRSHKTLSFSSQDLARYLCEVIRDMEQDHGTLTASRRPSAKERRPAAVRSLSSLTAAPPPPPAPESRLQQAPGGRQDRFRTLRAVVSELRGESRAAESPRDG